MADEAILRIVLDEGAAPAPTAPLTSASAPAPAPPPPAPSTASPAPTAPPPPQPTAPPVQPPPPATTAATATTRPSLVPADLPFGDTRRKTVDNLLRPIRDIRSEEERESYLEQLLKHKQLEGNDTLIKELESRGRQHLVEAKQFDKIDYTTPPPQPAEVDTADTATTTGATDPHEERKRFNEERARKRAQQQATIPQPAPPPDPAPAPAAPPEPEPASVTEPTSTEPAEPVTAPTSTEPASAEVPVADTADTAEATSDFIKRQELKRAREEQEEQERIDKQRKEYEDANAVQSDYGNVQVASYDEMMRSLPEPEPAHSTSDFIEKQRQRRAKQDKEEQERIDRQRKEYEDAQSPQDDYGEVQVASYEEMMRVPPPLPAQVPTSEVPGTPPLPPAPAPGPPPKPNVPTSVPNTTVVNTEATADVPPVGEHTYIGKVDSPLYAAKKAKAEAALPPPPPEAEQPPPPEAVPAFDPVALAKKRIEAEEQRRKVDEEYAKLKPPKPETQKSAFDNMLEAAEALRGTLGGVFGKIVGAVLDITARMRALRDKAEKAEVPAAVSAPAAMPLPSAVPVPAAAPPPEAQPAPDGKPPATAPTAKPVQQAPPAATAQAAQQAPVAQVAPPPQQGGGGSNGGGGITGSLAAAAPYAAIGLVIAGAIKSVVSSLIESANKRADKAGEYSPVVAQAQAMAEIRTVLADIRRARSSENELSSFIKAQSEMQNRWEDIKMSLMRKIIPVVTGILEVLSALFGVASRTDSKEVEDPTRLLLYKGLETNDL